MKRIFKALAFTVLVGCCTLSGSSFSGGAALGDSVAFSSGAALSGSGSSGGASVASPLPEEPESNAIQHPFLLTPLEPESPEDDHMVRSPTREEPPFQHPFLVNPRGAPEENDAVYVASDRASLTPGASDDPHATSD